MISSAKTELDNVRYSGFRRMMRGGPTFYGLGGLCALWVGAFVGFYVLTAIHESFWPQSFRNYWYLDSPLSIFFVVFVVFYQRPRLLASSRWRPKWIDFYVGIPVGTIVPILVWLLVPDPLSVLHLHLPSGFFIVPMVLMGPIVEELLFRGTFLESFKSYFPQSFAILLATLVGSLGHSNFWAVLPAQLAFSVLYVSLRDSLPASFSAHVTNNAIALLLASGIFDKWHTHFWSFWK